MKATVADLPGPAAPADSADPASASSKRVKLANGLLEGRGWLVTRLVVDAVMLAAAMLAAFWGARDLPQGPAGDVLLLLFPPLVIALFMLRGLYRGELQVSLGARLTTIIAATSMAAVALLAVAAFATPDAEVAPILARAWLFGTLYVVGGRMLTGWSQRRARTSGLIGKPTLLIGAGRIGTQVERRLREQPWLGLRPVGYLDANPPPLEMVPDRTAPILGDPGELARVCEETGARHVVLGFTSSPDSLLMPLVRECEERGLEVLLVPRLFESVNVRVGLEHIGGLPLFGLRAVDPKGWQFAIKHGVGRLLAALAMVVLSPLLIAVAIAVKVSSPGPILFRQRRIGRDGTDFEMLKFRSMSPAVGEPSLGPGDFAGSAPGGVEGVDRRTPTGRFLRSTSLDELPQLWNVVTGDMSLVGPRPERPEFVELFGQSVARYDDRHRVKSGITGWAQVNGLRGKTSLADRIEWDNWYIENWSLMLDLRILFLTVAAIFQSAE